MESVILMKQKRCSVRWFGNQLCRCSVLLVILLSFNLPLVQSQTSNNSNCADVVGATATLESSGSYRIAATVSSPYETGWDQYADAWQVVVSAETGESETILGTRVLGHPHVNEQPFTRTLQGVEILNDSEETTLEVLIRARDSINGYCGEVFLLEIGTTGTATTTANGSSSSVDNTNTNFNPPLEGSSSPSASTAEAATFGSSAAPYVAASSVFVVFVGGVFYVTSTTWM